MIKHADTFFRILSRHRNPQMWSSRISIIFTIFRNGANLMQGPWDLRIFFKLHRLLSYFRLHPWSVLAYDFLISVSAHSICFFVKSLIYKSLRWLSKVCTLLPPESARSNRITTSAPHWTYTTCIAISELTRLGRNISFWTVLVFRLPLAQGLGVNINKLTSIELHILSELKRGK